MPRYLGHNCILELCFLQPKQLVHVFCYFEGMAYFVQISTVIKYENDCILSPFPVSNSIVLSCWLSITEQEAFSSKLALRSPTCPRCRHSCHLRLYIFGCWKRATIIPKKADFIKEVLCFFRDATRKCTLWHLIAQMYCLHSFVHLSPWQPFHM